MAETKDLSGALFRVAKLQTSKHPSYSGSCVIDSRHFRIAGWTHATQPGACEGEDYISLTFTPADEPAPVASPSPPEEDDDIPF
jgi:hypothetical protein